jgi:2-polyprenyl-3-methyl-5-hydroxy-6-metoxy-1,4-benzoquinol methylase
MKRKAGRPRKEKKVEKVMKKIDETELRKVDKEFDCDEWGRYSRFFSTKEKIEKMGLEYKEGRAYKLLVSDRHNNIKEAQRIAIIQTILSNRGLSPKVYNIGKIQNYFYLEVEYLNGDFGVDLQTKDNIQEFLEHSPIKPYSIDLDMDKNYIDGKYIDFHGFEIDWNQFESWLKNEIKEKTHWGRKDDGRIAYQSDTNLLGKRDTITRLKKMELDQIDYTNQTVLDLGCSIGMMSYFAESKGAKVIGIDLPEVIFLATLYKFFNYPDSRIEFIAHDLKMGLPKLQVSIVFDFAMVHTIGRPKELANITKRLLVYEGHNLESKEKTEAEFKKIFSKVRFVGYTEDRGVRPIFWCKQ